MNILLLDTSTENCYIFILSNDSIGFNCNTVNNSLSISLLMLNGIKCKWACTILWGCLPFSVEPCSNNIELKPIKNVLLTGATGFLGSHILDSYFSTNNIGTIYCFVRNKNNKASHLLLLF